MGHGFTDRDTYAIGHTKRPINNDVRHRLTAHGPDLIYTNVDAGTASHVVRVIPGPRLIRIGCMELTMEAFDIIKRKVEGL
jgi:hypothetical protein